MYPSVTRKLQGPGKLQDGQAISVLNAMQNRSEGECLVQVSQELTKPTAAYFDKVFVMSEDEAVRQNRLAMLRDIGDLPEGIINFAQLPGF